MFAFLKKWLKTDRPTVKSPDARTAFDYSFKSIDGAPLPLAAFRGQAVLVVNTASYCDYTPQYAGLEHLYETYRDRGLIVVGVPSNDFGLQEPGTEGEIQNFCNDKYRITFPLTEKTVVTGPQAHPFYKWVCSQRGGSLICSGPSWNFHKYLIAPDGHLAAAFGSRVAPESGEILGAINQVLPK